MKSAWLAQVLECMRCLATRLITRLGVVDAEWALVGGQPSLADEAIALAAAENQE